MNNKTADKLPIGVALLGILGTGGYLTYNWLNKNKADPEPDEMTEAWLMSAETKPELLRMRELFEAAYFGGEIARPQYDMLYRQFIRKSYWFDLYNRGGSWISDADEFWELTENTPLEELHDVYLLVYNNHVN